MTIWCVEQELKSEMLSHNDLSDPFQLPLHAT
jgi:hypothetical protein